MDVAKVTQIDRRRFKHFCLMREEKEGGCWVWRGAYSGNGDPAFSIQGETIAAHRVAFIIWSGPIPDKLFVVRSCPLPICVNPTHLELKTISEVMLGRPRATHCKRGHEYSEANTRVNGLGARVCRECERARMSARRDLSLSFRHIA